jgi:hypothetical protein
VLRSAELPHDAFSVEPNRALSRKGDAAAAAFAASVVVLDLDHRSSIRSSSVGRPTTVPCSSCT